MFNHEKLRVYQEALLFAGDIVPLSSEWDNKHAFIDHLFRASESIVINLAESCRVDSLKAKQLSLDYSLGSALECASCLDIGNIKSMISDENSLSKKKRLVDICGKLIGLRKSWEKNVLCEKHGEYNVLKNKNAPIFHHEMLDVYQLSLNLLRKLNFIGMVDSLPIKVFRQIDETSTSILLNIAEGNGRYAELVQQNFLNISNRSTIKLATLIDLCLVRGLWEKTKVLEIQQMLVRIANMSKALSKRKGWDRQGLRQGSRER